MTVLVIVFRDPPVVVRVLALTEDLSKVHVVGDYDELKVLLVAPRVHDVNERPSQRVGVGGIQVRGRFVQRENAAVEAKRLSQRQADDQAS